LFFSSKDDCRLKIPYLEIAINELLDASTHLILIYASNYIISELVGVSAHFILIYASNYIISLSHL
jgi:hypothetical protein